MPGIFSKIVSGDVTCHKIAENDRFLAFLDVFPLAEGHVLVIPKQEVDYIFDLEREVYRDLWSFASEVASAIKKSIPCVKVGVAVIGLEVQHAHIHLVPINKVGDINFEKPKLNPSQEALAQTAEKIRKAL
jgi:histidine triad (HIT) family protein